MNDPTQSMNDCFILPTEAFGVFSIAGKDAPDYLHRQLSNEIRNLAVGEGVPTCFLNPQGRVLLHFTLWKIEDGFEALVCGDRKDEFVPLLDKFVFREEIEFKDLSETAGGVLVYGGGAEGALRSVFGDEIEIPQTLCRVEFENAGVSISLRSPDWLGVPSFCLHGERGAMEKIFTNLSEVGSFRGEWASFHSLRIERGTPWPDFEIDDSMIPYECGLDGAVSLTKGCYVGQEIVARMSNLGESPRRLRGLVLEGNAPPERGTPVRSGEVEVGTVLSAGFSSRLSCAVATSSIRKRFVEDGTELLVGDRQATVRDFPLARGDDD